ncbi:MAG: AzlD domain-containing protein [Campylobacterales bacterium]|nr:AzlD domain-containing protein [Campylobacterales bacterium]
MSEMYLLQGIVLAVLATYATRILPFLFFAKREPSPLVRLIEKHMPLMIMVILVFYAIRDVPFEQYPYGGPELLGIMIAGGMHLAFKNALVSIVVATVTYMVLIQNVL